MTRVTDARAIVVSGKGGVGKSTVAAAVAIAVARGRRHTLLAELEDREASAPIFGLPHFPHEERSVDEDIAAISVVPDQALVEYFRIVYKIPKISRALLTSKAVEFATQTAPGLRDILLIGTIMEAERRHHDGRRAYDHVVVDAPPTGRLPRLLDAPRAIAELVRAGPIQPQAQKVLDMVLDPARLHVVLVVQPEELSVRETIEAVEALQKMDVALGPVVVNGLWPLPESLGSSPKQRVARAARDADLGEEAAAALATVATAHARRAANQRAALETLATTVSLPRIELPFLFTDRIGRAEVEHLADDIEESGLL